VNYSRFLPVAALLAICLAGCSSASKPAVTTTSTARTNAKLYAISVDSAAFFRKGPQAGREPDKTLSKATVVKLIRPSFGYSKVQVVETGEQGYVLSEEIQPASSALLVAASAPKPDPLATPSIESTLPAVEQFNLDSSDPRLVPPPEDLPPSELPAPAPEP
jgi:outer membrane murein-binding lipoprotein Lpp